MTGTLIEGDFKNTKSLPKICDAHIHLFPHRLLEAILNWFIQQGWRMPYQQQSNAVHVNYLKTIGVSSAFVLGYVHKKEMSAGINLFLKNLCQDYSQLHPFAAFHQDDPEPEKILSQALDEWNFPGVKIHTFVQKVSANDRRLWPLYQMLRARQKGLVIHLSGMPIESPYTNVKSLYDVLKFFPDLKVTIAHMGLPNEFSSALKLAEYYPNVYLDTAFILGNPRFPMRDEWLRAIVDYPTKFIFGTDYPIMDYSPRDSIQALNRLPITEDVKTNLFWDNAMRFLSN